jgi:PAS domain S-box-containing protein
VTGDIFERRWRALLSFAPIIHFATGPDGIIRFTDGAALRAMGFAPGQNVGRSIYDLYGDSPWILDGFRRALGGEAGSEVGLMRGVWFSIQYIPLFDKDGKVEEVVGIATNIQELRDSEERYQRLASATFEGVTIHERGIIVDVNQAAADLFGYSPAEMIGKHALDLAAPESRDQVRQRIAEGGEGTYEGFGLRKDGSTFPVQLQARNLRAGNRPLRVACIRDLTERNRLLDAEKAAREAAEEALALREEFLSIASHELNTPLTSLKLRLGQLATGRLGQEEAEHALEISIRQTRRLTRLVADLVDASRIRTGRLTLLKEEMDLAEVAREALDHLRTEIARSHSAVELHAPSPARGLWDRQRLEQVVSNLISNAANYGLGKPITIRIEPGERVRLTVEDQGVGIPPEAQERIFERYERAASTRRAGGLGLGLYIAKQIIQAHGGTISVESRPGAGSVFTVELPARL